MRKTILLAAVALAACSQNEPRRDSQDLETFDSREPAPDSRVQPPPTTSTDAAGQASAPGVSVTAAPGVAFDYRYAFRLPNARISPVQEAHAAMCEKLGVVRCRITGMRYSLANENDVSASLELRLDPAIARQFGKDATKIVDDAEGMLVDQQIRGVDAGSAIEHANRSRAELRDELDRVNRELARPGLSNAVRDRLLSEAQSLRAQMRAFGEQKAADEESLAKTPMVFHYGSGKAIPGFDEPAPLRHAFERAGDNILGAIGVLIILIGSLLPWALLVALLVWAYRRLPARWRTAPRDRDVAPAEAPRDREGATAEA